MSQPFLALSYFVHLVATVIWLGGLASLTLLVWPEVQRALAAQPAAYALLSRLRRRLAPLTNFSLVVLALTGFIQMSADPNYEGALVIQNEWSQAMLAKHIAYVAMIVCTGILQFGVTPALERAALLRERGKGDEAEYARQRQREVRLTWLNAVLGLAVLAFTAWATSV